MSFFKKSRRFTIPTLPPARISNCLQSNLRISRKLDSIFPLDEYYTTPLWNFVRITVPRWCGNNFSTNKFTQSNCRLRRFFEEDSCVCLYISILTKHSMDFLFFCSSCTSLPTLTNTNRVSSAVCSLAASTQTGTPLQSTRWKSYICICFFTKSSCGVSCIMKLLSLGLLRPMVAYFSLRYITLGLDYAWFGLLKLGSSRLG